MNEGYTDHSKDNETNIKKYSISILYELISTRTANLLQTFNHFIVAKSVTRVCVWIDKARGNK